MMPLTIGPRVPWMSLSLGIVLGGCSGAAFSDADLGESKVVSEGSAFTVSLPLPGGWSKPRLNGYVVRFLNHEVDTSGDREVFSFRAEMEGETDINIPALPEWGSDRDFKMRIRVTGDSFLSDFDEWEDRWDWARDRSRDRD